MTDPLALDTAVEVTLSCEANDRGVVRDPNFDWQGNDFVIGKRAHVARGTVDAQPTAPTGRYTVLLEHEIECSECSEWFDHDGVYGLARRIKYAKRGAIRVLDAVTLLGELG